MNCAKSGQIWEGMGGWIVLIVKADESGDELLIHEMITLVSPDSTPLSKCPTSVSEYTSNGGMASCGWKRLF